MTEMVLILAIALVVLGPEKLPGIAKALGRATREFRKATREIQASLQVEEVRRTIRQRAEDEKKARDETAAPGTKGEDAPEGDGGSAGEGEPAESTESTEPTEGPSGGAQKYIEKRASKPAPRPAPVGSVATGVATDEDQRPREPEPGLKSYLDKTDRPSPDDTGSQEKTDSAAD